MARESYVIIGLAKTGTTAVAMTLRNTLQIPDFCMEPKELTAIGAEKCDRLVIKFLFDHWLGRVDQLIGFVRGSSDNRAPTTIAIVRDPRDEAVSRLHYLAYDYFATRPTTLGDRAAWLDIFHRKEAQPESIGLIDMENELKARFGIGFLVGRKVYEAYARFIDDIRDNGAASVHLLRYEDFVAGTIGDQRLRVLLSGSRNVGPWFRRVHRSGSSGAWRHFLTDRDLTILNDLGAPLLRRFDYSFARGANDSAPSRATGSDYVASLIDEARRLHQERQRSA
jgi:hypothetical protein